MLLRQFAIIFYICINVITLFNVSAHSHKFSDTRIHTLPAYAIASVADLIDSTICGKELQKFRNAVDQRILWGLKVLDSSGVFNSGFLYGNNYWLGSRSQCLDTMNTAHLLNSKQKILNETLYYDYYDSQQQFPFFEVNYFVAHFRHNNTLQYHVNIFEEDVISLGLCLPASCSTNDLNFILKKILHDKIFLINDLYFMDFKLIQIKKLKDDYEWLSSKMLFFICAVLAFSFFMTTTGTIYDIFVYQKYINKNMTSNNTTNNDVKNMTKKIEMETDLSPYRDSKIEKILICFSVYRNTREMFNTKLNAGEIPVIHGLKFLSMLCLIFVHTFYFSAEFVNNKGWFLRYNGNFWISLFDTLLLSVDIYFLSSGCLVTYLYLRDNTNKELIKPIGYRQKLMTFSVYIIKRFIRLTPAYMMALGILLLSSIKIHKISQFYMYEKSYETCTKYWWRNLLYINNLFGLEEMCMSWSWYLANDMQFFIIAIIVLMLSTVYFYAAAVLLGILLIGSVILNGYISYIYEYIPTWGEQYRLADILYFSPWIRIIPYIMGIITGFILTKINNNFVLEKKKVILCWLLSIISIIFIIFGHYTSVQYTSVKITAIYIALHRVFWAISFAWVVIACFTKHGGIVNQLLSFKGWIPLSRLTYCAYLLNPIIIRSISLCSEAPIYFQFLFIPIYLGYVFLSFFCAFVLSLLIEIPCISLMRMFIQYFNVKEYNINKKKL
ncbi:hypothetical protein P5V15_012740 [Pogonomyrmex californicus]